MEFTTIKLAAFTASLGVDTVVVSVSLGMRQQGGRWRTAGAFGVVQAVMVTVGLLMGRALGQFLGRWATAAGGVALMALGLWMVFFDKDDDEAEFESSEAPRPLRGRILWATALSVSMDELAGGVSMGFTGIPLLWTIVLIGAQGVVLTLAGMALGRTIRPHLGDWARKLPGIILGALGIAILIGAWKLI